MNTKIKLRIGTFAKNYNQAKIISLAYKNHNGSIYRIKLPFRKFILIII